MIARRKQHNVGMLHFQTAIYQTNCSAGDMVSKRDQLLVSSYESKTFLENVQQRIKFWVQIEREVHLYQSGDWGEQKISHWILIIIMKKR